MNNIYIKLENISFSYPGQIKPVLKDLNIGFQRERIGLIGDNGSGKTTLFHIIVGLLKPDKGNVIMNDEVMKTQKDFGKLRRKVGMLFQNADDQLFCPTVLEDVAFGPLNMGVSVEEAKEISWLTLRQIGLSGYENRVTHNLSGGEKRLVALATVLSMKPDVLLLDEPTNDLDRRSRHRLLDTLGELDLAYLLVTHDWDFLEKLTNIFYALDNGRLIQSDKITLHQHKHAHTVGDQHHVHSSSGGKD